MDAGIGPATAPESRAHAWEGHLLGGMQAVGVSPEDVNLVILTHLHPDHVGWCVTVGKRGPRPTFANARYVAHQADWDAFNRPEVQSLFPYSYFDETVRPLHEQGQLDLVRDADVVVSDGIRLLHSPGHTPGSMVVLLSSGGRAGLLWGDAIAHPAQLAEPDWEYVFDMDKSEARRSRGELIARLNEHDAIGAGHFALGRFIWRDGIRAWAPV